MSSEKTSNYIVGGLLFAFAGAIYYFGSSWFDVSCIGWNVINPVCWLGFLGDFVLDFAFLILAIWTAFFGIIAIAVNEEKLVYVLLLWLFVPLAIASWAIPLDPIPFVDEIVTSLVSIIAFGKLVAPSSTKKIVGF